MKRIIFTILALFSLAANAWDFELSAGSTQFAKPPNTIWYQNEHPHTFDLNSGSYSIGVSDYLMPSTRWRVAYTRLGNVSSSAQATSDAIYNETNHCTKGKCPLNTYRTEGSVRGFSLTIAPEKRVGDYKVFVEAGAFVYLTKFIAEVSSCVSCSMVDRKQYSEGWKFGPQIGVGVTRGRMSMVLTAYKIDAPTPDVDAVPNFGPIAMNLSAKVSF